MPGLLRGVARTAVVAGTASAVSGRVQRRQADKFAERDAHAAAQRSEAYAAGDRCGAGVRAADDAVRGGPAAGLRRTAAAAYAAPPRSSTHRLPPLPPRPTCSTSSSSSASCVTPASSPRKSSPARRPSSLADAGRHAADATGPEPAVTTAATYRRRTPERHGRRGAGGRRRVRRRTHAASATAPTGIRRGRPRRPAATRAAPAGPGRDRRRLARAGPGRRARDLRDHRPRVPRPGADHHRPPGAPCPRPAQRARLAGGHRRGGVGLPPPDLGVAGPGRLRRPPRAAAAAVHGRVRQVHRQRDAVAVVARRHQGPGVLGRPVDRPEQPGRPHR